MKAVEETGATLREIRELEDQVGSYIESMYLVVHFYVTKPVDQPIYWF